MAKKRMKKKVEIKVPKPEKARGQRKILFLIIFLIIIAAILFTLAFLSMEIREKPKETKAEEGIEFFIKKPLTNASSVMIYLPAVDNEGNGVITLLVVEAIPGSGRTLVDIDSLLFWADTQHSIRIAKNVAANISQANISNFDLIYNIYANASVIGGESAGAAITIATIAVLQNKSLRDDVMITGTINHDGTVGPVQAILPKAKAAKSVNASVFLVPLLQSRDVVYETRKHCEKFGPTEVCTIEQVPKKVNISKEVAIEVKEVETIREALEYFLKQQ